MRFLFAVGLSSVSSLVIACSSTVIDVGSGGGYACGPLPAGGSDGCPASHECIDGEWRETADACSEPECPADPPIEGDACSFEDQHCEYGAGPCLQDPWLNSFICDDGEWFQSEYCQPDDGCPTSLPIDGSDCTGWSYAGSCDYEVDLPCGAEPTVATAWCDAPSLTWWVELPSSCGE